MPFLKISRRLLLGAAGAIALSTVPSLAQDGGTLAAINKRGSIRVGWAVWYPYVFRDPKTNEITGIMPDYMAKVVEPLQGVKVEWVEDSTATLIAGLQSNKFDMTSLLGITEERAKAASFTAPLLQDGTALAGLKSKIGDKSGWERYNSAGTKISVTLGSNTDLYVTDAFKNAEIVRFRTEPESIAAVLAGRVEAMAIGRGSATTVLQQRSELMLVPASMFRSYPVAPVVAKDNNELREWLESRASELKASGELLTIVEKYSLDSSSIPN